MRWILHDDGSFDLDTAQGRLLGAWPGLDHRPVRCAQVEIQRGTVDRAIYHLADGAALTLTFASAGDDLELGCRLEGLDPAPLWVHPLCDALATGFDRAFRQSQGFSGPTGFVPLDRSTHRGQAAWSSSGGAPWTIDSHLLVGLAGAGGLVVAGPLDQRDWVFAAQLHSRPIRGSFRNREVHEHHVIAELGFRTEHVPTGGTIDLPVIRLSAGPDAFTVLRGHAGAIATHYGIRPSQPPSYHYCSWYHKTQHFSSVDLHDVLAGLERCDPDRLVQTVQIDDGWMTSHGDWLSCRQDLWPGGMEPAFRAIAEAGRRPGVWVAPYMVGSASELARQHPDWLLHWTDGTRVVEWKDYDGTKRDFEHYVLDTSHPAAFAWIRQVFRTLHAQGARFFKTDFMEWGFKDSTVVRRHTPGRSSMQYVRDLMEAIRSDIGDSYWLGCITYFAPMLGMCDGMRIASDVGLSWNGAGGTGNDGTGGGTQNMVEESFANHYANRVWWENDPDVVYLRDHHVLHDDGAWQALACWHGILGTSVNTSDEIHLYPAERRAWWDFLRPGDGQAQLPYFARGHAFRIAVRTYPGGWGVLLLNDRNLTTWGRAPLADLVGRHHANCFRWGPGLSEPLGELGEIAVELAAHRHLLIYVSRDGLPPPGQASLGGQGQLALLHTGEPARTAQCQERSPLPGRWTDPSSRV